MVGFAICVLHEGTWVTQPLCYLEDLFVDDAARGKGAGRALIEAIINEAREKGWSKVYWVTREGNPARALYDKLAVVDDYVRYRIHDLAVADYAVYRPDKAQPPATLALYVNNTRRRCVLPACELTVCMVDSLSLKG
ncbi:Predicted acetyltransferase [Leclercia adecarboxylata]|uniref:Predicted acetyltransferase n=1 Tax=Leclercia adecarboxylata TaxID=83655 RepID=A0A4U9HT55_9ENTR|nr:Predicted acetyltransferase [Leclercia adecarboxylata]